MQLHALLVTYNFVAGDDAELLELLAKHLTIHTVIEVFDECRGAAAFSGF